MFISFPAITWMAHFPALSVRGVNPIFKWIPPVLLSLHQCFGGDALALGQDIA